MRETRIIALSVVLAAAHLLGCPIVCAEQPETLQLSSPTSGICRAVFVKRGQHVQTGERLLAIGGPVIKDGIDTQRVALQQAVSHVGEKRNEYLKSLQDFQNGLVATSSVEAAFAEYEEATAALSESRSRLEKADRARNPTFIYSPVDATVEEVHIVANQSVSSGDRLMILSPDKKKEDDSAP